MTGKQKFLRGMGYFSFTLTCLIMSIYLTFPGDVLGQRIAHEVAKPRRVRFKSIWMMSASMG